MSRRRRADRWWPDRPPEYRGGDQITLDEADERALDVAAAKVQAEIARRRETQQQGGQPATGAVQAACCRPGPRSSGEVGAPCAAATSAGVGGP
jgi:hypothetical protein